MADPRNFDHYLHLIEYNQYIDFAGLEIVYHLPCPFCAAADWAVYKERDKQHLMAKGSRCKRCKRAARAIFATANHYEVVQVAGPEQPTWLKPRMRSLN